MSSSLTVLRCTLIMQLSPLHCLYLVKLIVILFIYKQQYRCDVVFTNAASRGHLYHMWRESADSSLHSGTLEGMSAVHMFLPIVEVKREKRNECKRPPTNHSP